MKNRMIIKLLVMMYTVCARLEMSGIQNICETPFSINKNILINHNGPLNPLRTYIMHKSSYIYNKRMFSQEIYTDYSLKKSAKSTENEHFYIYTRNPENDKAYKFNNNRRRYTPNYLYYYHKTMIYMFPCENNNLSIEPCRNDSFTRFLRAHCNEVDSLYLLAALLLLSEGIDVPIAIEKNIHSGERILLKFDFDEFSFIDLPLWLESIVPKEADQQMHDANSVSEDIDLYIRQENIMHEVERMMVYQKEAEKIVQFFKSLCIEPFLSDLEKCREPETQSNFNLGYFLDSPGFLIQSYIFEYIDNVEQYKLFLDSVHMLLQKLLYYMETKPSEQQKNLIKEIIDYYFIDKNGLYEDMHLNHIIDMCSLKYKIDRSSILPFTSIEMVPSYTRVPENEYNPESIEDFVQDETLQYNNHVETMLLNLFTCLTYNPETNLCSTEHMHGASVGLKVFFNKYSVPTESASQEKHRDWCRVVSRLSNPSIRYVRESRTELCGGLENILYVIYELFSENINIRAAIEGTINSSHNRRAERVESIKELFLNILTCLATSHKISIESSELEYLLTENLIFGMFGSIVLGFEAKGKKESIKLDILSKYSKFSLVSDFSAFSEDAKNELMDMQRIYNYARNYIKIIFWNYLNNSIERLNKKLPAQNYSAIVGMLDQMKISANYIFLCGRINSLWYKMSIINYRLMYNTINKLPESNHLLRITSNIIGSARLDNPRERKMILLIPFICNCNHKKYFPSIKYNTYNLLISELGVIDVRNALSILIDISKTKESFQKCFKNILAHAICYRKLFGIFGSYRSFEIMCVKLVKKYKLVTLTWTLQRIKSSRVDRNNVLDAICFLWLSYACINTPYNLEVIYHLYTNIDPLKITSRCIAHMTSIRGMDFNRILMVLEKEKGSLVLETNAESIEKYERIKKHFQSCATSVVPGGSSINPITI
ncbi:hypothetical protein NEQG_01811 [Nematocida parisii ERTm3]|uniref:Uncharacterized protein n=1 Tax=Nematocida parisii (strain ERTm3) TaxID=935791 RepID=I3EEU2_NEMP3|nr:hypothetical protein NEQG_01811 [Nematocida parisii ERTm3]